MNTIEKLQRVADALVPPDPKQREFTTAGILAPGEALYLLRECIAELQAGKLVPLEPTEAMLRAAQKAECDHAPFEDWMEFDGDDVCCVYRAMLAAAPAQEKPHDPE